MKVLFVEPAKFFAEESMNKIVKQTPHIGLAYVATATKEAGHTVKVLDVPAQRTTIPDYIQILKDFQPDAVGFTAMTHNIMDVYEYAEATKHFNICILTVGGGPHVNAMPKQTRKECKYLDLVVKGEGEITFPKLLNVDYLSQKLYQVVEGEQTDNLDTLPFPDWSLYDYKGTYAKAYSYKFKKMMHVYPIQTMRGCFYNCVFCFSHGLGKGVRFRSADNIFKEIKRGIREYDARFFYFADSSSTLHRKQMERLCNLIIRDRLDIAWKCETHVNHVDKPLLELMKEAGCELIFYGIESGNETIQEAIGKNLNLNRVRKIVQETKDVGLKVRAGFILGLPFDTKETVQDTIEFARELELEKAIFSILDVLPSTEVQKMVGRGDGGMQYVDGKIPRWNQIARSTVSVEVNDLTEKDLLELFEGAYQIVNPRVNDGMHKFCAELAYNFREHPEVLKRHVRDNLALIETFASQKQ